MPRSVISGLILFWNRNSFDFFFILFLDHNSFSWDGIMGTNKDVFMHALKIQGSVKDSPGSMEE